LGDLGVTAGQGYFLQRPQPIGEALLEPEQERAL
jgi:EAL domain-containing protein (putative c-di-GMP-specific phosphodiesterase class I)